MSGYEPDEPNDPNPEVTLRDWLDTGTSEHEIPPTVGSGPANEPGPASGPSHKRTLVVASLLVVVGLATGAVAGTALRSSPSRPSLTAAAGSTVAPTPTTSVPVTPTSPTVAPTPPSTDSATTAAPTTSSPPSTDQLAAAVVPGIVDINTVLDFGAGEAAGTGMILTSTGEVLTNNHVIDGSTSISVVIPSTGKTYNATVVGTDPTQDVAVLQLVGATNLTPIPVGDSSRSSAGDAIVAIGNAGGVGGAPAVVTGHVVATDQTITASDPGGANSETLDGLIEIDAPIQPGDSGGALVDSSGKVIGMNTAASGGRRFRTTGAVGFAIPISQALTIANDIEGGKATAVIHIGLPAFMGVTIDANGAGSTTGAVISGVQSGSPAARAGLAAGATITSIAGQPVTSPTDLSSRIKSHRPGESVIVTWVDSGGKRHSVPLILTTGPAD